MKKWIILMLMLGSIGLTACKNQEETKQEVQESMQNDTPEEVEWLLKRKSAFVEREDGWVYTFSYAYDKVDLGDTGLIPYSFYGVNLKYRYNDDYATPHNIQILGETTSVGLNNDMLEVASLLKYEGGEITNKELLNLTVDDLTFEEFDEVLFLDLIQKALTGEPHKEGKYGYLPSFALLEENYGNNYKFQIGFTHTQGCMDVVMIDVLYKTGNRYNEYKQLSDMVALGEADQEQIKLYELIEKIADGIVENNNWMYKESNVPEFSDVDISRLYSFLEDIEKNEYANYMVENEYMNFMVE